jgi:hypothetical protein
MSELNQPNQIARAEDTFSRDIRTPEERRVLRRDTRANSTTASRKVAIRGALSALAIGVLAPTMGPSIVNHVEQVMSPDAPATHPMRHLQNEVEAQTAHNEAAQLAADHIHADQH